MSTDLKPILNSALPKIRVTRFYGGEKAGICLELGQQYSETGAYGFIQISHQDAKTLADYLMEFHTHPMEMEEAP